MTDEPNTWRTADNPFARVREQMKEMLPAAVDANGWVIREAASEPAPVEAADPEPVSTVPTGPKPDPSQGFQGLSVPAEPANALDRIRNRSRAAL